MKRNIFLAIALVFIIVFWSYFYFETRDGTSFERNTPAMYKDIVTLFSPLPGDAIASPLRILGEARGNWYFEASFPIILTNWDGLIIAEGFATAQVNPADGGAGWMTTNYVPFDATLEFETPEYGDVGYLILKKDNPSGLPEHDDAFEIQVRFTR